MIWTALLACSTVSNAPLYEDATFLGALPSHELQGVPIVILEAESPDPVLGHGQLAAALLESLIQPLLLSSESIRSSVPAERDTLLRSWDPVAVVADGSLELWWVRGQVTRTSEDSDLSWVLEVSDRSEGPWVPAATGRHDPEGYGELSFDLRTAGDIVGLAPLGALEVDYDAASLEMDGHREANFVLLTSDGLDELRRWIAVSTVAFAWTGLFTLNDAGETLPGVGQVMHLPEGGRGMGTMVRDEQPLSFESCWTSAGEPLYFAGDEISGFGSESACTAPPF